MKEERRLGKLEATLGLTLIAGLLVVLVGVYVYRLDEPPPVTPPDPNWVSSQPAAPANTTQQQTVEQTSYRPVWLTPQGDEPPIYTR